MVKFCASCGTANTPDALYCAKCGAVIGDTASSALSTPNALDKIAEQTISPNTDNPLSSSEFPSQSQDGPKAIRPWKVAAIATAALVVI